MPKGDIELPNRSGVVDPTISARQSVQRTNAYLAKTQTRAAVKPTGKRSVASRMITGYRTLTGTR